MPKKVIFTKDEVIAKGFEMLKERGLNSITARNIAKSLKSSPAPIYSYYTSMDELKDELIDIAKEQFLSYLKKPYTDIVFLNVGMGIVIFAREEQELFDSIFLKNSSYKDLVNEFKKIIYKELEDDYRFEGVSQEKKDWLLDKCWIFAHGLATLVSTNFISNVSDEYIKSNLLDMSILFENVIGEKAYDYKKIPK